MNTDVSYNPFSFSVPTERSTDAALGGGAVAALDPLHSGFVLIARYRIVREVLRRAERNTYLAIDLQEPQVPRILQQTVLPADGSGALLPQARATFECRARALYAIQHPQLPTYRDWFRAKLWGEERFFLVWEAICGQNYASLLQERHHQGWVFSEAEVRQWLRQMLPVLDYLHGCGIFQGNISLESVLQPYPAGLPVLVGLEDAYCDLNLSGKPSKSARAAELADLGGLAKAALELTGRSADGRARDGRSPASLHPDFVALLQRAIAGRTLGRYVRGNRAPLSARTLLHAIEDCAVSKPAPIAALPIQSTQARSIQTQSMQTQPTETQSVETQPELQTNPFLPGRQRGLSPWLAIALFLLSVPISGSLGWWFAYRWIVQNAPATNPSIISDARAGFKNQEELAFEPRTFAEEDRSSRAGERAERAVATHQRLLARYADRRDTLGIGDRFFANLVKENFEAQYPERSQLLAGNANPELWREAYREVAESLLDKLSGLSSDALEKLGEYTRLDRKGWETEIAPYKVRARSLYDLTDARFFYLFPEQRWQDLPGPRMGQVWQAIARDLAREVSDGTVVESLLADSFSETPEAEGFLSPGSGKVYIFFFNRGDSLELALDAEGAIEVSFYPPAENDTILKKSKQLRWQGTAPESGYYEIVLANSAEEPTPYRLNLQVIPAARADGSPWRSQKF